MPSVGSEFCTVNETGAVGRQKNDDLSDFIRRTRTVRRHLGSELIKTFTHWRKVAQFKRRQNKAK